MAIQPEDILWYEPAVTAEGASHGGVVAAGQIATTKNGLWDDVSAAEAAAGDTEYRKIFAGLGTAAGSQVLSNPVVWIYQVTPSTDDELLILMTTTTDTVSDVRSDIIGYEVSDWVTPTVKTDGLSLGDFDTDTPRGIWLRRKVDSGASAYANNTFSIRVEGETG